MSKADSESGVDYGRINILSTQTPTLVVAADPDRQWLLLEVLGTVDVAVGDRSVTYDTGFRLRPGQLYPINTAAAVYAITGQNRRNPPATRQAQVQYLGGNQ